MGSSWGADMAAEAVSLNPKKKTLNPKPRISDASSPCLGHGRCCVMCLKVAALDDVVARPSKSLVMTVTSKDVVSTLIINPINSILGFIIRTYKKVGYGSSR